MTEPQSSQWVHYTEMRGDLSGLQAFAQTCAGGTGFAGAEVLHSPGQANGAGELYLLVTRWQGVVPPLELPAQAKGWAFAVLPLTLSTAEGDG